MNGAKIEFIYNDMNRLESEVKPDKSSISYEYDPLGNYKQCSKFLVNHQKLKMMIQLRISL